MKKIITLLIFLSSVAAFAQTDQGAIYGVVKDSLTGEPIPFANVVALQNNIQILATTSDFDGKYTLKPLPPGEYVVQYSYVGFKTRRVSGINVSQNKMIQSDANLGQETMSLDEVVIIEYERPLIEKDQTRVGNITTRQEIEKMAVRSVADIAKTAGNGVYSRDDGTRTTNVRGSRSNSSVTFIDGVKVINKSTRKFSKKKSKELVFYEPIEERLLYQGENYQGIADNEFEIPSKSPLSTFSIDVDKAAYANTRRFINQGTLPPVDAVRIEELINYFDYNYPQPEGEHPFSITTEMTNCPWNTDRKLALIGIQGKNVDMADAPKNNLVFLIDVSGSMNSYNKLELLKKGLHLLIDELRSNDRLAVVVYAGAAGVVLESTHGDKKEEIKRVLNQLQAGGSTAGGAGIHLAYQIAQENFIKEGNNRIILATDGDFNVGTSSQEALVKLIEEKRESGVFLSVLGLGTGNLQDSKMEQLANRGNGNYNYIDNLLEAKKVLVKEMGGTLFTIAKDVKVQAEFNPAKVKAYRLIGYVNRSLADEDFNDDKKDAGELGAGHSVTVLYEIIPVGSEEKIKDVDDLKYQKQVEPNATEYSDEVLTVKFRYKEPDGKKSILLSKVMDDTSVELESASTNLQFSAAVASFGMKLRKSESTEEMSYDEVIKLAKKAKGEDEEGYRAEFIKMVEMADLIR